MKRLLINENFSFQMSIVPITLTFILSKLRWLKCLFKLLVGFFFNNVKHIKKREKKYIRTEESKENLMYFNELLLSTYLILMSRNLKQIANYVRIFKCH